MLVFPLCFEGFLVLYSVLFSPVLQLYSRESTSEYSFCPLGLSLVTLFNSWTSLEVAGILFEINICRKHVFQNFGKALHVETCTTFLKRIDSCISCIPRYPFWFKITFYSIWAFSGSLKSGNYRLWKYHITAYNTIWIRVLLC